MSEIIQSSLKSRRLTVRIPISLFKALEKSVAAHNITMTKYVLRQLYMSLIKEGYLHDEYTHNRADIFFR